MENYFVSEIKAIALPSIEQLQEQDIRYSDNYYSTNTCMGNRWGHDWSNPPRNSIMCSDRVYADPKSNIMRFQAVPGVCDAVNDYYCVAMGKGFAQDAAESSGNGGMDLELYWGYTFKIDFTDDDGNKYNINVMQIDTKRIDDGNSNSDNLYETHVDSFLEFITSYDESEEGTGYTRGFKDTDYGRDNDSFNLDYDKFFGGKNVRACGVSAYVDGWYISGTYDDGYVMRTDRDGIPIDKESYIAEQTKRSIVKSVSRSGIPDHQKENIIRQAIKEALGVEISAEELERLIAAEDPEDFSSKECSNRSGRIYACSWYANGETDKIYSWYFPKYALYVVSLSTGAVRTVTARIGINYKHQMDKEIYVFADWLFYPYWSIEAGGAIISDQGQITLDF